mgnify:CR=1 FL=1
MITKLKKGIISAVMTADKADTLQNTKTAIHTNKEQMPSKWSMPRITPKAVATPFPPLNLKKIGYK